MSRAINLPPLNLCLTRAAVVRYAGASTDFNPIHWSMRHAIALGLPGVVSHGLFTMGLALRAVTDWIGDPGLVESYTSRFGRPIVVPDTDEGVGVRINGKVASATDERVVIHLHVTVEGVPVLNKVVAVVKRPPADTPAGIALAAEFPVLAGSPAE
jgi:acyl dehydratase